LYITVSQETLDNAYPCLIHWGDQFINLKIDIRWIG
jgi:hypothetical protein